VGNLWLAPYFGEPVTPAEYEQAVAALHDSKSEIRNPQSAIDRCFFHWELEFPEAFFEAHGLKSKEERGFDAVIGNPPYGMPQERELKDFANATYDCAEGRDDLYKLFVERSLALTSRDGWLSMIVSSTMLSNRFDARLRRALLQQCSWEAIVTFGFPVFDDPTVHSAVFVIRRRHPEREHKIRASSRIPAVGELNQNERPVLQGTFLTDEFALVSVVRDAEAETVMSKIDRGGQPLGRLAHIRQCIKTGDDAAYTRISSTPLPDPWKPVLTGSDVTRYSVDWPERYLNYGPWLARNWQNPGFFERPKLLVRETSDRVTAALDSEHLYLLSTLYSVYWADEPSAEEKLEYLLALLNSNVSQFFMHNLVFTLSSGAFVKARTNHYARLPIRRIAFTTPPDERARLVEEGKTLYHETVAKMTGGENHGRHDP